ncbi:MAG: DUF2911 domain-containing protein [Saprospiraceae bacterium]|nr:DUF2911 domain-containing protein [Saprospiraceae bacterium]
MNSSKASMGSGTPSQGSEESISSRPSPPKVMEDTLGHVPVSIHYGAPSVRGRTIFGELVPFGEIWRTGANEATVLAFEDSLRIGDQIIPSGQYSLFTIPGKSKWTIILNEDFDQWGAYNYDAEKDIIRFSVTPTVMENLQEQMRFELTNDTLLLKWAYLKVPIPMVAADG